MRSCNIDASYEDDASIAENKMQGKLNTLYPIMIFNGY